MLEDLIKQIVEQAVIQTLEKIGATDINRNDLPQIMNVKQVSEYLNVSTSYIYQNKDIPCNRIGKKLTFSKNDVDAWLEAKKEDKLPINKTVVKANKNKIYKIG